MPVIVTNRLPVSVAVPVTWASLPEFDGITLHCMVAVLAVKRRLPLMVSVQLGERVPPPPTDTSLLTVALPVNVPELFT